MYIMCSGWEIREEGSSYTAGGDWNIRLFKRCTVCSVNGEDEINVSDGSWVRYIDG